jgi:hypothetical protein
VAAAALRFVPELLTSKGWKFDQLEKGKAVFWLCFLTLKYAEECLVFEN